MLQALAELLQCLVRHLGHRALAARMLRDPVLHEACRQVMADFVGHQFARSACLGLLQLLQQGRAPGRIGQLAVLVRNQVDMQRLAILPVAGNLQNRRAAQTAVREQQVFAEGHALLALANGRIGADFHRQCHAGERGKRLPAGRIKGQRHQSRARRDRAQAELCSHAPGQIRCANLGNRQAAGGQHHGACSYPATGGIDLPGQSRCRHVLQALHRAGLPAFHAASFAFAQQQIDDVLCRTIAEQLALVLFVKGNAMALHQLDKVLRAITRQRAAAEMRILADELRWRGSGIGEVAAAAAADADLFGHLGRMIDQQHTQATLAGLASAEQAGSAGTYHHDIEFGVAAHANGSWVGRTGAISFREELGDSCMRVLSAKLPHASRRCTPAWSGHAAARWQPGPSRGTMAA